MSRTAFIVIPYSSASILVTGSRALREAFAKKISMACLALMTLSFAASDDVGHGRAAHMFGHNFLSLSIYGIERTGGAAAGGGRGGVCGGLKG